MNCGLEKGNLFKQVKKALFPITYLFCKGASNPFCMIKYRNLAFHKLYGD